MDSLVKPRTYVLVFAALLILTAATVGLSFLDLGRWHSLVGLVIAGVKALLIMLFFMHLMRGAKLLWLTAFVGLYWLGILLFLTMTDFLTRG